MEPSRHRGSDRHPRRPRIELRAAVAFLALTLIVTQGVSCDLFVCPRAGGNVAISVEPLDQEYHRVISDESGNAIIVWSDQRIHAQKVNAEMDLLWGDDGVVVTAADGWQQRSAVCGDGSGGVIATWEDCRNGTDNRDIYVQRIDGSGSPAWTTNGVAMTNALGDQIAPAIAPDGAGGAIVAWTTGDGDLGTRDISAQRVDASGTAMWTPDGVAVCTAAGDQYGLVACRDGSGGAILV